MVQTVRHQILSKLHYANTLDMRLYYITISPPIQTIEQCIVYSRKAIPLALLTDASSPPV